jgi:hypothetical protein
MEILSEKEKQDLRKGFNDLILSELKDLIEWYGIESTSGLLGIPIKALQRFIEKDQAGQLYLSDLPVLIHYLTGSHKIITYLERSKKV